MAGIASVHISLRLEGNSMTYMSTKGKLSVYGPGPVGHAGMNVLIERQMPGGLGVNSTMMRHRMIDVLTGRLMLGGLGVTSTLTEHRMLG